MDWCWRPTGREKQEKQHQQRTNHMEGGVMVVHEVATSGLGTTMTGYLACPEVE